MTSGRAKTIPAATSVERRDKQRVQHVVGETPRRGLAVQRQMAREGRDERGAHRALREEIADEIRNPERDVERVHLVARAEARGKHLIAREAEEAARQRRRAAQAGRSGQACDVGRRAIRMTVRNWTTGRRRLRRRPASGARAR